MVPALVCMYKEIYYIFQLEKGGNSVWIGQVLVEYACIGTTKSRMLLNDLCEIEAFLKIH